MVHGMAGMQPHVGARNRVHSDGGSSSGRRPDRRRRRHWEVARVRRRTPTPMRAGATPRRSPTSVLDATASEAPFDTVVIVMMENRSFDHCLGWLGHRRRSTSRPAAAVRRRVRHRRQPDQTYTDAQGQPSATHRLAGHRGEPYPYQGCGDHIPGHGWNAGRAQLDGRVPRHRSGNDPFAIGYYARRDLPFTEQLARRFTIADRWFASLLGPTFPNRQYLHAAQSARQQERPRSAAAGMFRTPTIWDNLRDAKVPSAYYYTDLPIATLWGERLYDITHSLDDYFDDAPQGTLAERRHGRSRRSTFAQRTDDHPRGRHPVGSAVAALRVPGVRAVAAVGARRCSSSLYDEWGGFFDHVKPPIAPRRRRPASSTDDFAQLGFRVPDHRRVAVRARRATSTTRSTTTPRCCGSSSGASSGAPPTGTTAGSGGRWWLTERDRHAGQPRCDVRRRAPGRPRIRPAMDLPAPADPCTFGAKGGTAADGDPFIASQQMSDLQDSRFKEASDSPWSHAT